VAITRRRPLVHSRDTGSAVDAGMSVELFSRTELRRTSPTRASSPGSRRPVEFLLWAAVWPGDVEARQLAQLSGRDQRSLGAPGRAARQRCRGSQNGAILVARNWPSRV